MRLLSSHIALVAGMMGTLLQWYDFAIFGYFAPLIAETYFPNGNSIAALLNTFAVFAVGYVLAPLGSICFGYIGDKYGRKKALTLSILCMAIPTSLISVVPGYVVIGIAAPLIITLLRMIQGFVASSEYVSSSVFLIEHAKTGRKALYGCLTSSAYSLGSMLAGLSASFFTASFMPTWGWRLGFAVALAAGGLIYFLRLRVAETPEYTAIRTSSIPRVPFLAALRNRPWVMLGIFGIGSMIGIITFGTYVFMASYLPGHFSISLSKTVLLITVALAVDALLEPCIALISEKVGYLFVICCGVILMGLAIVPVFSWIAEGSVAHIAEGLVIISVLIAIICAPLNAYMVSLFPQQYRCSGFGFAFNLGVTAGQKHV